MIHSAAKEHRVLLEHPQAGRSFPGIRDFRRSPLDGADKLASNGSDSREMLQKIQRHALAREQHVGKAARARDHFSGFDLFAIRSKGFELLLWIEGDKNFFSGFQSGDYHLLTGDKSTTRSRIPRQDTLSRDVAAAEIFTQEKSNARVEGAFVKPIHETPPSQRSGSADILSAQRAPRAQPYRQS